MFFFLEKNVYVFCFSFSPRHFSVPPFTRMCVYTVPHATYMLHTVCTHTSPHPFALSQQNFTVHLLGHSHDKLFQQSRHGIAKRMFVRQWMVFQTFFQKKFGNPFTRFHQSQTLCRTHMCGLRHH